MAVRRNQSTFQGPDFFVSLTEAAHPAEELVQLLEQQLSVGDNAIDRLSRNLSSQSVISAASSFAYQQHLATSQEGAQECREIGVGYCATVFEQPGTFSILKKAHKDPSTLFHDFQFQGRVRDQFGAAQGLFGDREVPRIPRPLYFIDPADGQLWWAKNAGKFPLDHQILQTLVLCSERIFPVPKPIREDLIDLFCPEQGRAGAKAMAGNKDCIVRVYLGRRRKNNARPTKFFSLRNFSLHLEMAEQIHLDIYNLAKEMAIGLAICHWRAKVDGNDVEFVLGSAPTILNFAHGVAEIQSAAKSTTFWPEGRYINFQKRTAHLWMLDFDKCQNMPMTDAGISQAVRAAEDNDPYFPKPHKTRPFDQMLWVDFSQAYLKASKTIMDADGATDDIRDAPQKFIKGWEDYRKSKLENGKVEDK